MTVGPKRDQGSWSVTACFTKRKETIQNSIFGIVLARSRQTTGTAQLVAMLPNEVVVKEGDRQREAVHHDFFAMAVGQPSEAAILHPDRCIRSLDMRRADHLFVGISDDRALLHGYQMTWRVASVR